MFRNTQVSEKSPSGNASTDPWRHIRRINFPHPRTRASFPMHPWLDSWRKNTHTFLILRYTFSLSLSLVEGIAHDCCDGAHLLLAKIQRNLFLKGGRQRGAVQRTDRPFRSRPRYDMRFAKKFFTYNEIKVIDRLEDVVPRCISNISIIWFQFFQNQFPKRERNVR